ncbi:MAG TPA: hypothetical protein VFO44_08865 [Steroidobacteraceae bacterium]|nr:hypothetical protein [Steroidobacteraceae bacterium]
MISVPASSLGADPIVWFVTRRRFVPRVRRLACSAALAAIAGMSMAAYAAETPYNPDHLSDTQVARMGEICRTVMGLRPSQALTDNLWPGDPDPASQTNDYRGCIATLSNSIQAIAVARQDAQAERDCRGKGLKSDSSELAVCLVSAQETAGVSSEPELASLSELPLVVQPAADAPMHTSSRLPREKLACAAIGLAPNQSLFKGCVQGLRDVMTAGDMAANYRN